MASNTWASNDMLFRIFGQGLFVGSSILMSGWPYKPLVQRDRIYLKMVSIFITAIFIGLERKADITAVRFEMANRGETSSSRTHILPKPNKRPKTLLSHVVDFFLPSWLADYLGIKLPNGCRTCERRNLESRDFECSCSEQEKYLAEAQQQTIQSPSASNFLQPPYSSSLIETPMDCPKPLLINPSFNPVAPPPAGLFIFSETTKTPTAISGGQRSSSTLKSCNLDRLKKSAKSSQQTFQSASASASASEYASASAYACNLQTPNVASPSSTAPMNWPAMPVPPTPITSPIPISSYTSPTPLSSAPLTPPCPCVFGQNTNKFVSTPPLPASRSIFYEAV